MSTRSFKTFILVFSVFIFSISFAQKGKHGSLTVGTLNNIVNEFTTLTANASIGDKTISVAASSLNSNSRFTTTLQVGDLIMIYQAQGAIIKTFNTVGGQDSTYGEVLNYGNAGKFEFAQVFAVPNATSIVIDCDLQNNYTVAGKTQIVRIPRYTTLTVNAGGAITTEAWNGTTGGILSMEVNGSATINGSLIATGLGFRGGIAYNNGTFGGNRFVDVGGGANEGGYKGEGIAGSIADYSVSYNGSWAMGAPANGGGGGDSHNAGGGGGANGGNINAWVGYGTVNPVYSAAYDLEFVGRSSIVSSGGGRGGYTFSSANLNPLTSVPHNTIWGGDNRRKVGGFGGRPLDYSSGSIYFGGGGGAGHCNNLSASNTGGTGGNGGGLIYLQVYGNISGTGTVVSNGTNGVTSTGPNPGAFSSNVNGNDSGGGGGGGGTIMLATTGNVSGIAAIANGGRGGNQTLVKGGFAGGNTEAEGPGGGGGGGYIAYSNTPPATQNVLGAASGTTNSQPMANFPPNGASGGGNGSQDQNVKLYEVTVSNQTVCLGSAATLTATTNTPLGTFTWYNSIAGASQIGTGAVFSTSVFTTPGTYTVFVGVCGGTYREPVLISVIGSPTLSVNSASICGTQTAVLTATGATSYTWNTSATTATIAVSPTATTLYTVIGSVAGCTAQTTATVSLQTPPSVTVVPSSTIICPNQTLTLNASGTSGTYSWSTGAGNTPSISITSFGVYTATLSNACGNAVYSVNIADGPGVSAVLSASDNTICAGQAVTLTAVGNGTFAWSSSTLTTNSITVNSPGIYTVSVTNQCGVATASFQIDLGPQPTINIVPSQTTFCTGQTASLTANGAATYTWSDPLGGTVNGPIFTTTAAAVYTVNGSSQCGNASAQITVTFQISPDVSVSSDKNVLCPGESAVLTATNFSGGGNFVWTTSSNTTNIEPVVGGGVYTVSYANGCGVASVTIAIIQSTLIPSFIPSAISGYVPLTVTFTNTSVNNMNNQWTFGNGSILNSVNATTTYDQPGTYTVNLVIENAEFCLASTALVIEVKNVPLDIIPELVSPNGDGKNDKWEIKGLSQFTNNDVQIFNRWGNLVFSMKNYDNSFDGTPNVKGKGTGKLPSGTYFYILNLGDSQNQNFHGYFQLAD